MRASRSVSNPASAGSTSIFRSAMVAPALSLVRPDLRRVSESRASGGRQPPAAALGKIGTHLVGELVRPRRLADAWPTPGRRLGALVARPPPSSNTSVGWPYRGRTAAVPRPYRGRTAA